MRFGVVYAHPLVYDAMLWLLYRGQPRRRFQRVAAEIPPGSAVLDLCAGTGMLHRELEGKRVEYTAVDVNPRLVAALRSQGIRARCSDVRSTDLPAADVVVMNSSLYHFHPDVDSVVRRMLAAARRKVVILEPVRNVADSGVSWLGRLARLASTVDGVTPEFHFDAASFERAMQAIPGLARIELLPGGRDMLAVFDRADREIPTSGW
jgi:SAM-dependent methyltransferase